MGTNQKIYRIIIRWPNGATEEIEPYSEDEVAKHLRPGCDLGTVLESWRKGFTETSDDGENLEFIHFVGDAPEGVRINRTNTDDATSAYRLTMADGTFFEKEFPATNSPDDDIPQFYDACREMVTRVIGKAARPVEFCALLPGCEKGYELNDVLNETLIVLGCTNEPLAPNILDNKLPYASDGLPGLKLTQLCHQAIEIMNVGIAKDQEGEQIREYLRNLNLEILKRVALGTLITLLLALAAAFGGGVLTLYAWGGTMLKSVLNGMEIVYAASVIVAALGIANKKLTALEDWASAWAANQEARRREKGGEED